MATRTIALITGGNNGIGYEAVKALLQSTKPYHVLMGSRSIEKGKLAVEKLQQECPGLTNTVEIVQVDISNDKSIEKAYEQVKSGVGHIDVLINNAGMFRLYILSGTEMRYFTDTSQQLPLKHPQTSHSASSS